MNRLNSLLAMLLAFTSANPSAAETDFAHEVIPILKKHCVECHGGQQAKGGFSINTRALFLENEAAIPGEPDDSLFLHLVQEEDKDLQ
ncbi:MAG: c-type cytochrome domain-containing protein, partial [Planctomycetota bacterium]|nr:c-type cytochrome domain-containing protein [Planctomycetota bacterium]